ncbi:MAG: Hemimethylated DNA binding protein [uncultured Thiotrichaceae bacterium]|uniref:Heat shock protein HspQ n=1 Tax=uncultured Thiotrichaceae bacterium TaxID=298394 RepID=A0A6S6UJS9_9GAMM|nr:MAG: Hemimethylated DNA binding protein [uncultured Thiotrichaceae bacterium]
MLKQSANYNIGQVIHHRNFNYRGVIVDVDPNFQGSEEWYEKNATTNPSKESPWYHVLVDDDDVMTYVAEANLKVENDALPVENPLIEELFESFEKGQYSHRVTIN